MLVARPNVRGGLRELLLCEVVVGPGRESRRLGRGLLAELVQGADADYVAAYAAPGTEERALLARAGFVPVGERGPNFTVRPIPDPEPIDAVTPDPRVWDSWRLSVGDLEIF